MKVILSIIVFAAALSTSHAWARLIEAVPGDNEETRAKIMAPDSKTVGQFCPKCLEHIAEGDQPSISPDARYQIVNAAGAEVEGSGDEGTN